VHFALGDDGLTLPWFGTVFVNPPYGPGPTHEISRLNLDGLTG
jgi:hypothetical protein